MAISLSSKRLVPVGLLLCVGLVPVAAHQSASKVILSNLLQEQTVYDHDRADVIERSHEPIKPVPSSLGLREPLVRLGEQLFNSPLLSAKGDLSCQHCHDLTRGGTDGREVARGFAESLQPRNTPSVFNVGLQFALNQDGRYQDLETLLWAKLFDPAQMGGNPEVVIARVKASPWGGQFAQHFGDAWQERRLIEALADYLRSLNTPGSPFDRYLQGEAQALDPLALEGYQVFKRRGCASCHNGRLVGGNLYQPSGIFDGYFEEHQEANDADLGRYFVTGREDDRYRFRVPSLRNVALTAPYYHDGSIPTLELAVEEMGEHQLGMDLPAGEIESITHFLRSLTGEYQGAPL